MPPSSDIHRRIADAVARIHLLTGEAGRSAADGEGLSPLQALILRALTGGEGLRIGALARQLKVTPGTISVAVDALEEKGLARRGKDPDDHRAVRVTATASGARSARRLDSWGDDRIGPIVEELGGSAAGAVLASLLTVIDAAERRGLIDSTRMCLACRHFRPFGGEDARSEAPHHCALLERDIGPEELQVDCPDFEAEDAASRLVRTPILPAD